jgi:transcriptional regulator with XRE-family HTH domain
MDDTKIGRTIRALRHRRGWRQVDLAQKAGVGRSVVSDLEIGRLEARNIATVRKIVAVFGLTFEGGIRGLGADADRVLDERHAALLGACAAWLGSLGWQTAAEVSYSEWGERGSVDLLAWHTPTANLLVIEIKTELASVEQTLRKHDEKVRLAATIARRLGWRALTVSRLLVFPEDRTQRRRVIAHASVLMATYPARSREVRAWCRTPSGPLAGLLFLTDSATSRRMVGRCRRERVRRPSSQGVAHR